MKYTAEEIVALLSNKEHVTECSTKHLSVSCCNCLYLAAKFVVQNEPVLLGNSKIRIKQKINRKKIHFTGYHCGSKNPCNTSNHNEVTCYHCLKAITKKPALIVPAVADQLKYDLNTQNP